MREPPKKLRERNSPSRISGSRGSGIRLRVVVRGSESGRIPIPKCVRVAGEGITEFERQVAEPLQANRITGRRSALWNHIPPPACAVFRGEAVAAANFAHARHSIQRPVEKSAFDNRPFTALPKWRKVRWIVTPRTIGKPVVVNPPDKRMPLEAIQIVQFPRGFREVRRAHHIARLDDHRRAGVQRYLCGEAPTLRRPYRFPRSLQFAIPAARPEQIKKNRPDDEKCRQPSAD